MTKRQQRMIAIAGLLLGLGAAAALGFTAIRKNMMYFYTPSDLVQRPTGDAKIRLGGLVVAGTLKRGEALAVDFDLADCTHTVPVHYEGILPDLFREGQGIVATGRLDANGHFVADEVLAKHDENYMPPDLKEALTSEDSQHSCEPFKSVYQTADQGA